MNKDLINDLVATAAQHGVKLIVANDESIQLEECPPDPSKSIYIPDCTIHYHPTRKVLYVFCERTGVCVLRITGLKVPPKTLESYTSWDTLAEIQMEGHADISTLELALKEPSSPVNGRALVR